MSGKDSIEIDIDLDEEAPELNTESARKLAIRRKIEDAQEAKRLREEFGEEF